MGLMQFWRLVLVDTMAVVTALVIIGVCVATGSISIEAFFTALLVGQVAGIVLGIVLLPASERVWRPMRGSDFKTVGAFGGWRGAQVAVPQLMLTLSRVLVIAFAGGVALGLVEGARIFVAPVLLIVQGLGSYLLSSYVRDSALGLPVLRKRAWKTSLMMIAGAVVVGTAIVLSAPYLGHLVSGPSFNIERLTVAGWVVYVMASASFQPFASLAAVRGRQRRVFTCRLIDATVTVIALTALLAGGVGAAWTPFVLAAGLFLGGLLVRQFVLAPLSKTSAASTPNELRMSHA